MITLKETTKSFDPSLCHTYMVSDDKFTVYGYKVEGDVEFRMMKVPLRFNTKGRTFTKVK